MGAHRVQKQQFCISGYGRRGTLFQVFTFFDFMGPYRPYMVRSVGRTVGRSVGPGPGPWGAPFPDFPALEIWGCSVPSNFRSPGPGEFRNHDFPRAHFLKTCFGINWVVVEDGGAKLTSIDSELCRASFLFFQKP